MRARNTMLLAIIFVSLAAYVYLFELKKEGKGARLLDIKQDEVERVALIYPDHEIRLEKERSGKWRMTHPWQAAADRSAVSGILSTLSASEAKRTVENNPSPADLKKFGLDQPWVKVEITLKSGLSLPTLLVGSTTPVGQSAYVKRGKESAVLLTGASLPAGLDKKPNDFLEGNKKK